MSILEEYLETFTPITYADKVFKMKIIVKDGVVIQGHITKYFSFSFYPGGFWFRLFGHGLSIVNNRKHPKLFSMRMGLKKNIMLGNWRISFLRKIQ